MKKVQYTAQDLEDAYRVWSMARVNNRDAEWYVYQDIRDGLPLGTSEKKAIARFQRKHTEYNPNKQDTQVWK